MKRNLERQLFIFVEVCIILYELKRNIIRIFALSNEFFISLLCPPLQIALSDRHLGPKIYDKDERAIPQTTTFF